MARAWHLMEDLPLWAWPLVLNPSEVLSAWKCWWSAPFPPDGGLALWRVEGAARARSQDVRPQPQLCPPPGPAKLPSVCRPPLPEDSTCPHLPPLTVRVRGLGDPATCIVFPVSPAIFLLYSRGSPLPLWSKTIHSFLIPWAFVESLLCAWYCARGCPDTYIVGNKLAWPLWAQGSCFMGKTQTIKGELMMPGGEGSDGGSARHCGPRGRRGGGGGWRICLSWDWRMYWIFLVKLWVYLMVVGGAGNCPGRRNSHREGEDVKENSSPLTLFPRRTHLHPSRLSPFWNLRPPEPLPHSFREPCVTMWQWARSAQWTGVISDIPEPGTKPRM